MADRKSMAFLLSLSLEHHVVPNAQMPQKSKKWIWAVVVGGIVLVVTISATRPLYRYLQRVWNVHTEECLYTLTGHTSLVASLLFEPERDLVVAGSDGTFRVWDVQTGSACIALLGCLEELPFAGRRFGLQLRGNILVSYYDSEVWVWDIREGGSCLHHLNGQTSKITSLQLLDSGLLVTGSMNGSVMLWDVEKGTFIRDLVRSRSSDPGPYNWDLRATETSLVCGVRSVDRTEATKLIFIDFDASYP